MSTYSIVGYLCLYTLILNCCKVTVQTTPTALQPQAPTTATGIATQTSARTNIISNYTCQPSRIVLNISVDKPVGSNETISISCDNWNNRKVDFGLPDDPDVRKYFAIEHFDVAGPNILVFTVLEILQPFSWNSVATVSERHSKTPLNKIRIEINVFGINHSPTIWPSLFTRDVREDDQVGTEIGYFTLFDQDSGEWGELEVYSYDIPEELKVSWTNDIVRIRTRKLLDADKYNNYNQTEKYIVTRSPAGPVIIFNVIVKDKPGLTALSTVKLTIIDIGDEEPFCSKNHIEIRTPIKSKGHDIANLHGYCTGGNYVSKTVSYSLKQDFCSKAFTVEPSGKVIVQNKILNGYKKCELVIVVADASFRKLRILLFLVVVFVGCPADTDYMNIAWDGQVSGNYTIHHCPRGYDGIVTRYCDKSGEYQDPVYNCTSSIIAEIYRKVLQGGDSVNVTEVLNTLANATSGSRSNGTLFIGDLNAVDGTLSEITDLITANITNVHHVTDSFMETANNILEEKITPTWKVMMHETGSGAESVLENVDRFVAKIVITTNTTAMLPKSNLYLKIGAVEGCGKGINFPDRGIDTVSDWVKTRQDQFVIGCNNKTAQSYSGVMYRNLTKIIPLTTNDNRSEAMQLNAPVISFTFFPNTKRKLDSPVEIRYQLYNKHWENASCSFWAKTNRSQGFWSEDGCQQIQDDQQKDIVICICNHLTNFAVLMSPSSPTMMLGDYVSAFPEITSCAIYRILDDHATPRSIVLDDHATALSIISITGCVISMICLFLNIAIHAHFWRVIKSARSIIHIHLSCSLFLAYILFLSGIDRTENEDVCTAVAALLHLVFLIVFFIMLTEGCYLAYTVVKPLSTRRPDKPLLALSYVLAVFITAVSIGLVQTEGYGNENACWLSTESGLIWAFLGPVLAVIVINLVIVSIIIRVMCGTTAMSKKSNTERARAVLRCILILMPVMGLTWVFGAFSVNEDTLVFQYLFAIFNSLQGLLIFVFHCLMNKKIREAFRIRVSRWRTLRSSGLSEGQQRETQDTDM